MQECHDGKSRLFLENNFTILRLCLAMLVVLFHFKVLGGMHGTYWPCSYPEFSVNGFFVVSGCLIYSSFHNKPTAYSFFIRRIFRLYPLYLFVIMAQTVVLLSLQHGSLHGHAVEAVRYLISNALFLNFLQKDIGGLLSNLPDHGFNPSLWTLKVEVAFYLAVPPIWLAVRRFGAAALAGLFLFGAIYTAVFRHFGAVHVSRQLPGVLQYFVVGIALDFYRHRLAALDTAFVCLAALASFGLVTLIETGGGFYGSEVLRAAFPVLAGCVVYAVAVRLPPVGLGRDFSYGVYLFHAPLIQSTILLGLYRFSFSALGMLLCAVLVLALLAERLIERPFIALGKRVAAGDRFLPSFHPTQGIFQKWNPCNRSGSPTARS